LVTPTASSFTPRPNSTPFTFSIPGTGSQLIEEVPLNKNPSSIPQRPSNWVTLQDYLKDIIPLQDRIHSEKTAVLRKCKDLEVVLNEWQNRLTCGVTKLLSQVAIIKNKMEFSPLPPTPSLLDEYTRASNNVRITSSALVDIDHLHQKIREANISSDVLASQNALKKAKV